MSFRSRSRTQAPLTSRRRSLSSSSRMGASGVGSSGSSSAGGYNYNGSSYNSRPLSTGYYPSSSTAGSNGSYQSPYTSIYSSRESLYGGGGGSGATGRGSSGSYYTNGNGSSNRYDYIKYHQAYQPPSGSCSSASTCSSGGSASTANSSPTKSNHRNGSYYQLHQLQASSGNNQNHYHIVISKHNGNSYGKSKASALSNSTCPTSNSSTGCSNATAGSGGYESSRYGYPSASTSSYGSDHRYVSPYSSSYDNGVTTASLSFKSPGLSSSNSFKGSASARLLKTKSLSTSNSSLNTGSSTPTSAGATVAAIAATRSNSLREQERKSRNRTRSRSAAQRSISASSEKSEGYESGSERTSRSRTGSTATASTGSDSKSSSNSDKAENGDGIDYKALWEAAKLENDKLKQLLKQKDEEAVQTRATLERFANATTKNSLSEIEKRERRAMERKVSELEEELKLLQKLKTENDRLRAENRALTRVVSKLTTSAQSQLAKSK
ncbi:hypothetical protein AWZ03_003300 [Drosophila navojoa]|uniref:cGMP-dependent protein kinase interacting domain-containing protein n=1 Tax=Drosophila navojoa TaxID=7232 RepID=A0A484BRB7_DRONA|nr:hypothetical protein AWZ03_003300 [Drosophila navojoa]